MSTRPIHIVCAVDLSECSSAVIEHALDEARRYAHVVVHFITVLEVDQGIFNRAAPTDTQLQEVEASLRALVEESLPAFSDSSGESQRHIRFHIRVGRPDYEIVELAYEAQARRIIVGRRGARIRSKHLGGIASRVVQESPCTVLIVQLANYDGTEHNYERCLDCVDVRESSGGEQWFCQQHQEGRMPRLTQTVGVTSPIPGWGIF